MSATGDIQPLIRGRHKQKLLYRQLSDRLRGDLEAGLFQPGAMLPSMDTLARQHRINKLTARRAIADLAAAGLVYSVPGRGTFVSDRRRAAARPAGGPLSVGGVFSVNDKGQTGPYHTEILDAVRSALAAERAHLLMISTTGLPAASFCRLVGEAEVDGLILLGAFPQLALRHVAASGRPIVLIDDTCRGTPIDSILVDNRGGGHQAVQHLTALGHRRLAFVTGPAGLRITRDRLDGAWDALAEAGIDRASVRVVESDFSSRGGYDAMIALLRAKRRPTGVFFLNDEMASGGLQALYERSRLAVPDDLSIVGFDDISWSSLAHPPLTTVRVEKELVGRTAVERLVKRLSRADHIPTTTVTPTRLIVRKSTAAPIQRGGR